MSARTVEITTTDDLLGPNSAAIAGNTEHGKSGEMTRVRWGFGGVALAGIAVALGLLRGQPGDLATQLQQAPRDGIRQGVHDAVQESIEQAQRLPGTAAQDARDVICRDGVKRPAKKHDPIESLFDFGEHFVKSVDDVAQQVLRLSPEECRLVGERTHRLILAEQVELNDLQAQHRLKQLAGPMIIHSAPQPDNVRFTVLDSEVINAFSHIGNYVYVNRGLLELVTTDDEMRFVLGHELGHLVLGHCERQVTYSARAEQIAGDVGQLAQFAYSAIAVGYSKEQEFDADFWSMMALEKLGRPRSAAIAVLELIAKATDRSLPAAPPAGPLAVPDRLFNQIERHFRSHPPTAERIQRLRAADYGR